MNLLILIMFLFPADEGSLKITDPWVRPSGKGMGTALYFNIENTGTAADTLYKVECDFAGRVEMHETFMKDEMMGMRQVDNIIIQPSSSFSLKPGAHHVMVMKLKKELNAGKKEKFTLFFKQAGEIKIIADVRSK